MSKHTPGPWLSWGDCNGRLQIGPSTNYTVAQMMFTPFEGQKANARLIAAAPELLDALRMVLDDPDALDGRPRTFKCVRAAIAKATGEAA